MEPFEPKVKGFPLLLRIPFGRQSTVAAATEAYIGHPDTGVANFPVVHLTPLGETDIELDLYAM